MTTTIVRTRGLAGSTVILAADSGTSFLLNKRAATASSGVLTYSGNLASLNTITIGGKAYIYRTALGVLDGDVLLGASAAASLLNLFNAINLDYGMGTLYSGNMTSNSSVIGTALTATTLTVTARIPGTAGNSINALEDSGNSIWNPVGNLGGGTDASIGQNNDFVITLPTTPVNGTVFPFTTEDNGITTVNNQDYFTNWRIQSPIANGFEVRGNVGSVPRVLITTPTDNSTFTHESLVIGFSGTTQNSERRYEAGENIKLTFYNGKWRGNLLSGSRILGIGDI